MYKANDTRLSYDSCSYMEKLKRTVGPGLYALNVPYNDCLDCSQDIPADPSLRFQSYGPNICTMKTAVDDSSELRGLNYKNSKCNTDSFLPNKYQATGNCNIRGNTNARACLNPQESTRLSNPAINLKESAVNRWEWLCDDPQDRALESFDRPVNYRMVAKDNHIPLIEIPQDQSFFLPNNKYNENNPSDDIKKWNIGSATNSFAPGNPNGNLNYNLSCV
jgi:hypothetical protein|tara:strand:- start:1068 stop:1727 length:660 start_codon:yes stop_codon:yes gene_type:complete